MSISKQLDDIEQRVYEGKYPESIQELGIILQKNPTQEETIRAKLLISLSEIWVAQFETRNRVTYLRAYNITQEAYEESVKINNLSYQFDSLILQYECAHYLPEFEKAERTFEQIVSLAQKLKNEDSELFKLKESYYIFAKATFTVFSTYKEVGESEKFIDSSINRLKEALTIAQEQDNHMIIPLILLYIFYFYFYKGDFEKYFDNTTKLLEYGEKMNNIYLIAESHGHYCNYYGGTRKSEEYMAQMMRTFEIVRKIGNKAKLASLNSLMGWYYLSVGDYDKSLEYYEKSFDYHERNYDQEIDYSKTIGHAWSQITRSGVYSLKGDLKEAIRRAEEGYEILKKEKPHLWWNALPSITQLYLLKDDLDKALEIVEVRLKLHEKTGYTLHIGGALRVKGIIQWQKGMGKKAIDTIQKSLTYFKQLDDPIRITYTLYLIAYYYSEMGEMDLAKKFAKEFEKANQEIKGDQLKFESSHLKATLLLKSEDSGDKHRAEGILENLSQGKLSYSEYITINLSLCEALLKNVQQTGDKTSYSKLKDQILELFIRAQENNSYSLIVETLLLWSKIALIEFNVDESSEKLNEAEKLAEEKGLERLLKVVREEKDNLKPERNRLMRLDGGTPINKRMEIVNFDRRMNGIKKTSMIETIIKDTDLQLKANI